MLFPDIWTKKKSCSSIKFVPILMKVPTCMIQVINNNPPKKCKKKKFHLVTVGFEPTTRDSIVFEAAALPSELVGKLSFNFAVKEYGPDIRDVCCRNNNF